MKKPPAPTIEQATRHVVYRDMMAFLPIASIEQTGRFMANLSIANCLKHLAGDNTRERKRGHDRLELKFIDLRTTPDIGVFPHFNYDELMKYLRTRYADRLAVVAGFYQSTDGWQLNLPKRCFLVSHRAGTGHIAGILCQPIDRIDSYFLLSSAQQGGPRAERLCPRDRAFFEQFKQPMPIETAREILKLAA